jgi:hypothetical protein
VLLRYQAYQQSRYRRLVPWGGVWDTPSAMIAGLGSALIHYWDVSEQDSVTHADGLCSALADLKGSLNFAQATEASRPTYTAGADMIYGGGSTRHMEATGTGNLPVGSAGCEVFVWADQKALVADTTTRIAFSWGGSAAASRQVRRMVVSGENRLSGIVGDGTTAHASTLTTHVFAGRMVARLRVTSTAFSLIANAGLPNDPVASVPNTATTRARLMANTLATVGAHWNGGVGAVMVIAPDLSDHLRSTVWHTLMHRTPS